jgi:hypothetical protein
MWFVFLVRDLVVPATLQLCKSFQTSYSCIIWWTHPLKMANLLGLIIRKIKYGLESIGS